jgi:membrane-bound lytic murein transglycosylase B
MTDEKPAERGRLLRRPAHANVLLLPPVRKWLRVAVLIAVVAAVVGASSVARPASSRPSADAVAAAPATTATSSPVSQDDLIASASPTTTASPTPTSHRPKAKPKPRPTKSTPPPAISALTASGIPVTALMAYQQAAVRANRLDPVCHIPWPLLAGIGRVESDHGRFADSQLYADGETVPRIIGIPLDGHGTALIRDTDHGRLDGDTVYDRAVGPMQFIPSTWAGWGVDANHDGKIDPSNIFDAAAAAADYLCRAGGNLATGPGQVAAVLAYNHSSAYLTEVLALEKAYAAGAGVPVPAVPVPTTPPKPPKLPPVNPGPPASVRPVTHPAPSPTHRPTPAPTSTHRPTPAPTGSSCPTTSAPSSTVSSAPSTGGSTSASSPHGGAPGSSSSAAGSSSPSTAGC